MEANVDISSMVKKINVYKKEKNAVILAHNYQHLEVQKVADFVGDSFQLSRLAADLNPDLIIFCGVKFMAETAKLLSPRSKVLLSDGDAGCPMADMVDPVELKQFKDNNPDHLIVCYVNSSVEVKALSDVCVTSSNAVKIVNKLPKKKPILFVPDQNLGSYVMSKTNRKISLWHGMCPIHHLNMTVHDVHTAKLMHPKHSVIVHPECIPEIVKIADFVGSTSELAKYTENNDMLVIGTEVGLIRALQEKYPNKSIYALSERAVCVNMKKTSLNDVLDTLLYELNEIKIPDTLISSALLPINKMMELS